MHTAHVVHHVPGRIRFKIPGTRPDAKLLENIERALGKLPAVQRIKLNLVTGSVVVDYDSALAFPEMLEQTSRATAKDALIKLEGPEAGEYETAFELAQEEFQSLAQQSITAEHLLRLVTGINAQVKAVTGNLVDLRVLLPLCLSAYSLVTEKDKPSPLWVTLLIFSFNAFVSLHPPRPAPLS